MCTENYPYVLAITVQQKYKISCINVENVEEISKINCF